MPYLVMFVHLFAAHQALFGPAIVHPQIHQELRFHSCAR